jgi:hypothetical protein
MPFALNKIQQQDYDAIMDVVLGRTRGASMRWEGKSGPSVQVETRLKWPDCKALYLTIKDELHDMPIPNTNLYYFVGSVGVNFGKAGFRISGHTRAVADIAKSETRGVLHIEN